MKIHLLAILTGILLSFTASSHAQLILNIDPLSKTYYFTGSSEGSFFEASGGTALARFRADPVINLTFQGGLPDMYFDGVYGAPHFATLFQAGPSELYMEFASDDFLPNVNGVFTLGTAAFSYASAAPDVQLFLESMSSGATLVTAYSTFVMQTYVHPIPEPSTYALIGMCGLLVTAWRRSIRSKNA